MLSDKTPKNSDQSMMQTHLKTRRLDEVEGEVDEIDKSSDRAGDVVFDDTATASKLSVPTPKHLAPVASGP